MENAERILIKQERRYYRNAATVEKNKERGRMYIICLVTWR